VPFDLLFQVIAVAPGYGPAWVSQHKPVTSVDLTLRLVPDLPIQGRILDLNGKPVAGAVLRIQDTIAYANPEAFLQTVRDRAWPLVDNNSWNGPFPGQPKTLTTDAAGRFRLTGAGRERVVEFQLEGPGIQYGPVRALVREMKAPVEPRKLKEPASGPNITKVYGATFDHAVLPSRPIRGVIRDKQTGRPVAGVEIIAFGTTHRPRSDRNGRFEVLGCPKSADGYGLYVQPTGLPYFSTSVRLPDTTGLGPIPGDIELIGGIRVRGRVTHAVTGKPLAGARVHYSPLYPNPFVRLLGPDGCGAVPCSWAETGPDGSYLLVVLPGPGMLGYIAPWGRETFMSALITADDLRKFFGDTEFHGNENMLRLQGGVNSWSATGQGQFQELLLIRPGEKEEALVRDVALRPARPLHGKIVGPDEKPLTQVTIHNPGPGIGWQRLEGYTFSVDGLNPRRPHHLVFVDRDRKLGVFVTLLGEQKESLTVRLKPCAAVSGRLLDADGEPVADAVVRLEVETTGVGNSAPPRIKTDRDGRFRIEGIVPGLPHQARFGLPPFGQYLYAPFTLRAGEKKDLGDVRVKR
jgi:hypothetical protein